MRDGLGQQEDFKTQADLLIVEQSQRDPPEVQVELVGDKNSGEIDGHDDGNWEQRE